MARSTSVCQIIQRGLVQTSEISFILHLQSWRNKWRRDLFARVLCYQSAYIHSTTLRITINLQCGGFNPPDINDRYCISLAFKYLLLAMFFLTTRSRTYRYTNELYYLYWNDPILGSLLNSEVLWRWMNQLILEILPSFTMIIEAPPRGTSIGYKFVKMTFTYDCFSTIRMNRAANV